MINETQSKDRSRPYFEGDVIVNWDNSINEAENKKTWDNAFYRFSSAVTLGHPERVRLLQEYNLASDAYFQGKSKLLLHTQN